LKGTIHFFFEDTKFRLASRRLLTRWISETIAEEKKQFRAVNFIFCSDAFLLEYNQRYLNHDTLTDIITFSDEEEAGTVSGDIYISIDRVKENAGKYFVDAEHELHRVMIHGILHMVGYSDKGKRKYVMRQKEDYYLNKFEMLS
jgi:probable rRNA maturation factor